MCGIFGMFGRKPLAPPIAQVLRSLKHRGPDDEGVQVLPEGYLAHTRLAIIDLSTQGHQPMTNAEGTVWITYNGEIYNYRELREALHDYPFRTATDTEVILAAYERWGTECLQRLRGMFAFGLWDARRNTLFCATDRFSIKPLYYCVREGQCMFASEIKPIALCGVPLQPNERMLYHYLAMGLLNHDEQTLFEGIFQLPPGTFLLWRDGQFAVRRYWSLEPHGDEPTDVSDALVEERLREAVRLHLRSDVEVGLSLSSGLDSNVLRSLVQELDSMRRPLHCFTYSFPGTPYDEWERLAGVRSDTRPRYHAAELRPEPSLRALAALIEVMEEPVGGLGIVGYWRNAERAAECGIKVLLDGQGADETFAGYRYYYEAKIRQQWDRGDQDGAVRELRELSAAHGETDQKDVRAWMTTRPVDGVVMAPDSTSLASTYLQPEFAARFVNERPAFDAPFRCEVKNAMYRDLRYVKIPKLLRFQDKCAMAWGVEVRVPYLDHELVEFLYRIPSDRLLAGGLTKSLLRQVAGRSLAREQLAIPKLYVAAPQREWIKTVWHRAIEDLMQNSSLAARGYIEPATLLRQFREYVQSPELGNSFFVWKFVNLELWYRTFCERSAAAAGSLAAAAS